MVLTGETIRAARALLGWTQDRLGLEAGLVRNTVVTLEAGRVPVSPDSEQRILRALERAGIRFTERVEAGHLVQGIELRRPLPRSAPPRG